MRKLILYGLLICPLSLAAQKQYTLEQCRQMALKQNKEIAASVKQTAMAHYMAKSYKGNFFPNFTANGAGFYSGVDGTFGIPGGNLPVLAPNAATGALAPNGNYAYFPGIDLNYKIGAIYAAGVQMEQPLYMGGKITAAYKMALLNRDLARLAERKTASEVVVSTDKAYMMMVKAKEMMKVAGQYNKLLMELHKNVQDAFKHGLKLRNDVLKVQVKLNDSELAVRKAENALRLARMNLCHEIGISLLSDIDVSDDFPTVEQQMAPKTLDITNRPEYGMVGKQVDIARQQVKLARSEMLPQVGVKGMYSYLHGVKLNDQYLLDKGNYAVMLNVSVPLFHFGERSNKIRSAKAQLQQARLQQENANEQMLLELTRAANNLDEARLECDIADRSLTQAEENMTVSGNQYRVGLETLSDYLEAQTMWQQSYEARVNAHFNLYLTFVEYRKAEGNLQ
ncbi:MAG: TolC family protein [Bacteroides sp.]|jgi:outer membrane protein TolC|nr:TolC family protein [Bacteroides sp.]